MKVAIVADTHGGFKPLFDRYKDKIAEANLVCILGDMYRGEVQLIVDFVNVPIVAIHGNHDDENTYKDLGIYMLHETVAELSNGLSIVGFEGSSRYKPSQIYGYTQDESVKKCSELPICDILISHDGPRGYCGNILEDAHCGLQGITDYIIRAKPKLVFFGHHHKNTNFKIGNTDCYNVYELGIFDIENGKVISYQNYNL